MEDTAQAKIVNKASKALKQRLKLVDKHIEKLLERPLSDTYGKLPVNEKCELEILLSYVINCLLYIYQRTEGVDPQGHAVLQELERIKNYIEKVKLAEGKGPKPTTSIDKEAAARFIRSALSGNPNEDKGESTSKRPSTRDSQHDNASDDSSSDDEHSSKKASKEAPRTKKRRPLIDPFSAGHQ